MWSSMIPVQCISLRQIYIPRSSWTGFLFCPRLWTLEELPFVLHWFIQSHPRNVPLGGRCDKVHRYLPARILETQFSSPCSIEYVLAFFLSYVARATTYFKQAPASFLPFRRIFTTYRDSSTEGCQAKSSTCGAKTSTDIQMG